MSTTLEEDEIHTRARLIAFIERVTGHYFPGTTMSERFERILAECEVPQELWSAIKALAGEIVQGHRGSSIAHQMPAPFFPRPPWIAAQGSLPLNHSAIERGELMRYFCEKINSSRTHDGYSKITMARMGKILQGIPTGDLYYLKRVCTESANFSKRFWWELDPQNCKR